MALHLTANEFFLLLTGTPPTPSSSTDTPSTTVSSIPETSIESVLAAKAEEESIEKGVVVDQMALAMESKLSTAEKWGRLAWAGAKVEFDRDQDKLVVRPSSRISLLELLTCNLCRAVMHSHERLSDRGRLSSPPSPTRPTKHLGFSRTVNRTE